MVSLLDRSWKRCRVKKREVQPRWKARERGVRDGEGDTELLCKSLSRWREKRDAQVLVQPSSSEKV